jgi:hypothetical protein
MKPELEEYKLTTLWVVLCAALGLFLFGWTVVQLWCGCSVPFLGLLVVA